MPIPPTSPITSLLLTHLTTFLLWSFLPPLLTRLLLLLTYHLSPSLRPVLPPSPTPSQIHATNKRSQTHHKILRISLVTAYLVLTISKLYLSQSSHYTLLSLPRPLLSPSSNSDQFQPHLKSHWRKLARTHHPDKVGAQGEAHFVRLRRAVETLEDEGRRWAYHRFGESVGEWKRDTTREYLKKGVLESVGFWIVAGCGVLGVGLVRKEERGNFFWRMLLLLLSVSTEFHLLLRGESLPPPIFLSTIFPNRESFEHIQLVRQTFISLSMGMSQVLPLLFDSEEEEEEGERDGDKVRKSNEDRVREDVERLWPLVLKVGVLTDLLERELGAGLAAQLAALGIGVGVGVGGEEERRMKKETKGYDDDDEGVVVMKKRLTEEMTQHFLDLRVQSTREGREVWDRAVADGLARTHGGNGNGNGNGVGVARRQGSPSLVRVGSASGGGDGTMAAQGIAVKRQTSGGSSSLGPGRLPSPPLESD
ncbi:hypothetical protein T439DRAFT_336044 [Meredithblackwellia eburnea MCA 4105]